MILFFDTETTGFLNKFGPTPNHLARVCQLAAVLTDDNGEVIEELNAVICPDGWTIPESASKVHGITTQRATDEGFPMAGILGQFNQLIRQAKTMVAFNFDFDAQLLRREADIYGIDSHFPHIETLCVLEMATPICQIPPTEKMKAAGFNKFKPPRLGEAYKILFGKDLEGAHDAMTDVIACKEVYFEILKRGQ